jgi:hypothetical protein
MLWNIKIAIIKNDKNHPTQLLRYEQFLYNQRIFENGI